MTEQQIIADLKAQRDRIEFDMNDTKTIIKELLEDACGLVAIMVFVTALTVIAGVL